MDRVFITNFIVRLFNDGMETLIRLRYPSGRCFVCTLCAKFTNTHRMLQKTEYLLASKFIVRASNGCQNSTQHVIIFLMNNPYLRTSNVYSL